MSKTIEEVRENRKQLDVEIFKLIDKFEKDNGVFIKSIGYEEIAGNLEGGKILRVITTIEI